MDQQAVFLVSPLVKIFPPMTEGECAALQESVREAGLLEEITLWRGTVTDGFHRPRPVIPAKAGIQTIRQPSGFRRGKALWIPASAGMTEWPE